MTSVSLVVTDLDGTLWHTDDHLPREVIDAWAAVEASGIPVLVATGRRTASTRDPLARFGLAPEAVVLNGALGLDLARGDRFHRAPFGSAEAAAVLGGFHGAGLDPIVYVDHPDHDAFITSKPSTHPDHAKALGSMAAIDDLERVVADEAVLGFSMIGVPFEWAEAAAAGIGDRAEVHLDRSLDFVGMASFTVAPLGQSKWDGVLAYCRERGIDPGGVLALADGANDLELLDRAAIGLVPAVAHPEALKRATHVIPAAAEGGWAAVLDHI